MHDMIYANKWLLAAISTMDVPWRVHFVGMRVAAAADTVTNRSRLEQIPSEKMRIQDIVV